MFQSTPSRRGRQLGFSDLYDLEQFQSTPSRRGRLPDLVRRFAQHMFQSTPSRRGRHCSGEVSARMPCFNPLPHAEGDAYSRKALTAVPLFQSTPSRRGRRRGFINRPCSFKVSIHSLTQRETIPEIGRAHV